MRVVTWNVNGLRSALSKRFLAHIDALAPDVLLLQEVRALPEQLPAPYASPPGWHVLWHPAERKGYAGTAIWSRTPLRELGRGAGGPDPDGRVLLAETSGVVVGSVYLPSGASSPEAQARKDAWMPPFRSWARAFVDDPRTVILAGDLNIAPTPIDIHDPKGNAKNSGFLPHERAWFGDVLADGWTDLPRAAFGPVQGPYSWWSNRGNARALDRGWRIDHLLGNPAAAARFRTARVHRDGGLDTSDHAPVLVDDAKP